MCLTTFQWHAHPDYPLILVSNRDEAYDRPASRIHFWQDFPNLLAGRDLKAMGTWMGITKSGRFANISNDVFSPFQPVEPATSRGNLVKNYLISNEEPLVYSVHLKETRKQHKGYQLLFGDMSQLFLYQNATGCLKKLDHGTHSISNSVSSTSLERNKIGKDLLTTYIQNTNSLSATELADLFHHTVPAEDVSYITEHLPISEEEAKKLSSVFITGETFGTVATSVVMVDKNGEITYLERKYNKKGMFHDTHYSLAIEKTMEAPIKHI